MKKMSKMVERMFETAYKNGNTRPDDLQWAMQEYERQKRMEK